MKTITLRSGETTLVDDDIFEEWGHLHWYLNTNGYATRYHRLAPRKYVNLRLHRVASGAGEGQFVHHINGNKLDNRRENFEIYSNVGRHRAFHWSVERGPAKGRYRGVYRHTDGKWAATIKYLRVPIHLGHYATAEEAAMAWDHAARFFYGPDYFQNFP